MMTVIRYLSCWLIFCVGTVNILYWTYRPQILNEFFAYVEPLTVAGAFMFCLIGMSLFHVGQEKMATWKAIVVSVCASYLMAIQYGIINQAITGQPNQLQVLFMEQWGYIVYGNGVSRPIPAYTLGFIGLGTYFFSVTLQLYNFWFSLAVKIWFSIIAFSACLTKFFGVPTPFWDQDMRPGVKTQGCIVMVAVSIVLWIDKYRIIKRRNAIKLDQNLFPFK